ncbi:MAG: VOC family protein [Pseudomonadota bacterium]
MSVVSQRRFGDFNWVDLSSPDYAASKAFYAGLFGWEAIDQPSPPEGDHGPYAMFELDGEVVAGLGELPEEMVAAGAPVCWNAYVHVDDIDRVVAEVTARGASVVVPPSEVGEHGRLAYFADLEGAVIALWQSGSHCGSTRVDEPGTLCWAELATRGLEAASRFYSEVFGWTTHRRGAVTPSAYLVAHDGTEDIAGMLKMTDEWEDMPAHWSVYFEVSNAEESAAKVKSLGGEVRYGPFEAKGVGHIVVCQDNVGAHFHLMQLDAERRAARRV